MLHRGALLAAALILVATAAEASVGLIEIPDKGGARSLARPLVLLRGLLV